MGFMQSCITASLRQSKACGCACKGKGGELIIAKNNKKRKSIKMEKPLVKQVKPQSTQTRKTVRLERPLIKKQAQNKPQSGNIAFEAKAKRLNRKTKTAMAICGAILLGILLPIVFIGLPKSGNETPASIAPPTIDGNIPPVFSAPAASSMAEQPLAQPAAVIAFSEEEIASLNAMLDAWALVQTEPLITEDDKGEPLKKPYRLPDGGNAVALWFMDIDSGAQYMYNAGLQFSYASIMKAPYAAYLYTRAALGTCDLAEVIVVGPESTKGYEQNTGIIRTMPLPAPFTVEQLIGYAVSESDTVALKVLLKRYPAADFLQWAAEQGVSDAQAVNSVASGKISAADAGILLQALYKVIQENPYGPQLRTHMELAANKLIKSNYPVAHKYGWDEDAFHDIAVVFAPHPYLMVILTDKWGGTWEEREVFGTISTTIEAMVTQKYAVG